MQEVSNLKKEQKKTKRSRNSSSKRNATSKSSVNNMNYEIARDMGLNSSRESCSNNLSSRSKRESNR